MTSPGCVFQPQCYGWGGGANPIRPSQGLGGGGREGSRAREANISTCPQTPLASLRTHRRHVVIGSPKQSAGDLCSTVKKEGRRPGAHVRYVTRARGAPRMKARETPGVRIGRHDRPVLTAG